ncbi:MAG: hypothetical protein U1E70_25970 [Acetobacteraceae bacterium]
MRGWRAPTIVRFLNKPTILSLGFERCLTQQCTPRRHPDPDYLRDVYTWAYLTPLAIKIFDRQVAVQTILWGNAQRASQYHLSGELTPGDRVFPANRRLRVPISTGGGAHRPLGPVRCSGHRTVQVALTRRKLAGYPQAHVTWERAAAPRPASMMSSIASSCCTKCRTQ